MVGGVPPSPPSERRLVEATSCSSATTTTTTTAATGPTTTRADSLACTCHSLGFDVAEVWKRSNTGRFLCVRHYTAPSSSSHISSIPENPAEEEEDEEEDPRLTDHDDLAMGSLNSPGGGRLVPHSLSRPVS